MAAVCAAGPEPIMIKRSTGGAAAAVVVDAVDADAMFNRVLIIMVLILVYCDRDEKYICVLFIYAFFVVSNNNFQNKFLFVIINLVFNLNF